LALTVVAPKGTSGTVEVPLLGSRPDIAENGRLIWHDGHAVRGVRAELDGDYVAVVTSPGTHTFAWSRVAARTGTDPAGTAQ
jgi:hypothetical protein